MCGASVLPPYNPALRQHIPVRYADQHAPPRHAGRASETMGKGLSGGCGLVVRYSDRPNGVFGSKVIIYDLFAFLPHFADEVFEELRRAHVFLLLRGDKAAQAVSNVRCNQLSLYHVREAELATIDLGNIAFEADVADIFAKERWLLRQEGDLMDELRQRDIRPTILSYEACVQSRKTA